MTKETVFLSYSRSDSDFVLKLAKDLQDAGIVIWLDQLNAEAGSRWDISIENALNIVKRFIVILSPASVVSDNVLNEVDLALEKDIQIIPILLSECKLPLSLRRVQFINFTGDYQKAFGKLLGILKPSMESDNKAGTASKENISDNKIERKSNWKKHLFYGISIIILATFILKVIISGLTKPTDIKSLKTDTNYQQLQPLDTNTPINTKIVDQDNSSATTTNRKNKIKDTNEVNVDHKKATKQLEYVNIKLIVNSEFQNALITVDGQPANIVSNALNIKIVRVENNMSHTFELAQNGRTCRRTQYVNQHNQQIICE